MMTNLKRVQISKPSGRWISTPKIPKILTILLLALSFQAFADENWIVNPAVLTGDDPCDLHFITAEQGGANPNNEWYLQVNLEYSEDGITNWQVVSTYYRHGTYAFDYLLRFAIDLTGQGLGDVRDPLTGYYRIRAVELLVSNGQPTGQVRTTNSFYLQMLINPSLTGNPISVGNNNGYDNNGFHVKHNHGTRSTSL